VRAPIGFAFAVAPGVGAALAFLTFQAFYRGTLEIGLLISILMVTYAIALGFGVPAFILTSHRAYTSPWTYALGGTLVSAIVAVPVGFLLTPTFGLLGVVTGFCAGLTFGLIVRPKSNPRLERP
jgi:hypothetical protein